MKRILAITFLNFFISGGLTLLIPLLLLERNVDLTEIGLILSVFPLVFLVVRIFLAALADLVGWARFYIILFWPGSLFSTIIFFIASSTPFFLLGKIIEGKKTAPVEIKVVREDGKELWIEWHSSRIHFSEQQLIQVLIQEISEKKVIEEMIEVEFQKLKELDEIRKEFILRTSHELKTPLNSICSISSLFDV